MSNQDSIKNHLFDLIKSLSKTEKSYFKKYSRLHISDRANKYVLLFDAIEKQKVYDEEQLQVQLGMQKHKNRFAVIKKYLYEQVLSAMEAYHNSHYSSVKSLINHAEFLFEKGLYGQAKKNLLKAEKMALEADYYPALFEIYGLLGGKIVFNKFLDFNETSKILEKEREAAALFHDFNQYKKLFFSSFGYYFTYGTVVSKEARLPLDKIMSDAYLSDISKARTWMSKLRFYEAHYYYAATCGDTPKAIACLKNIGHLYQANPKKKFQHLTNYMDFLNNSIQVSANNREKKYREALRLLHEMEALGKQAKTNLQQSRFYFYSSFSRLLIANVLGPFGSSNKYIAEIERRFAENRKYLNNNDNAVILLLLAISYFNNQEYDKALRNLNYVRNEIPSARSDFGTFARLFYLIVHLELGNMELVSSLVKSMYRFFLEKEKLNRFEGVILQFFRKIYNQPGVDNIVGALAEFLPLLRPSLDNPGIIDIYSYFDFESWIESKIENKSFREIIKRKQKSLASAS